MTRLLTETIIGILQAASDAMSDVLDYNDPRLVVMRQEITRAKALLAVLDEGEMIVESKFPSRPTLQQALAASVSVGVTVEEADAWWHTREASDWMKGSAGGGTMPVGKNWAADLKVFTNGARNRIAEGKSSTRPFQSSPQPETVWQLKTALEAVNAEIEEIESFRSPGAWGDLPTSKRLEKTALLQKKSELRRRLAGLGNAE